MGPVGGPIDSGPETDLLDRRQDGSPIDRGPVVGLLKKVFSVENVSLLHRRPS